LPAPTAGDRRESLGREQAFEFLLLGSEADIRRFAVGRERRVDARNPKRQAIEMRRLARAFERKSNAPEIVASRQRSLLAWRKFDCARLALRANSVNSRRLDAKAKSSKRRGLSRLPADAL
jgi:hypothetical protein